MHHKNVLVKTRILTAYITGLTLLNAQGIGKHNEVVIVQSQYIYRLNSKTLANIGIFDSLMAGLGRN